MTGIRRYHRRHWWIKWSSERCRIRAQRALPTRASLTARRSTPTSWAITTEDSSRCSTPVGPWCPRPVRQAPRTCRGNPEVGLQKAMLEIGSRTAIPSPSFSNSIQIYWVEQVRIRAAPFTMGGTWIERAQADLRNFLVTKILKSID